MNLQKFKLEERIKLSYLKNRGDILKVIDEVGIVSGDYVKKVIKKIKKKQERNISVLISDNLMQYILTGHQSRIIHLMEMLKNLDGREQLRTSICCRSPVIIVDDKYQCLKCNNYCEVKLIDNDKVYKIKQDIIESLREEDRTLVDFADKMGYTNKVELPPSPVVKQNILVMKDTLSISDKQVVDDLSNLSPIDREKIRKELESKIIDVDSNEE